MQAMSAELSRKIGSNSSLLAKATLTLANGKAYSLDGAALKSMSWEQAVSSDSTFDVGGAIAGKLKVTLWNYDGRWDSCDFTDATIKPSVGARLGDMVTSGSRTADGLYVEVSEGDSAGSLTASAWRDGHALTDAEIKALGGYKWISGGSVKGTGTSFSASPGSTVTLELGDASATHEATTEEWIPKGVYIVSQPDAYGDDIELTCNDNLMLLSQHAFSEVKLTFPATLAQIVAACCSKVGLAWHVGTHAADSDLSYSVPSRTDDMDKLSLLQMVSYAAQAAGRFVRCRNTDGAVLVDWYDMKSAELEGWLDGGTFSTTSNPYSDGDPADGGSFDTTTVPYSDGYEAEGGSFDSYPDVLMVSQISSLTVGTDDVVITGISVTAQNEIVKDSSGNLSNGRDGETALAGNKGYVLSIEGNPLIPYGKASSVANSIFSRIGGMRFAIYDVSTLSNPAAEPGDAVAITDRAGRTHISFAASVSMELNGAMELKLGADTPARRSSANVTAETKAAIEQRNALKREKTAREIAMAELANDLQNASGLYKTEQTQPDGSKIYYLHDKKELSYSGIVWKMTATAIAVSTDGGKTYATGLTADGTAILNRIYAIGIDAQYITAGLLTDKKGSNYWNLDTGEFSLKALGDYSTTSAMNAAISKSENNKVVSVDVMYGQNQSTTSAPTSWSTDAPTWKNGYYIWSKTVTKKADGSTAETEPVCITGAKGETGATGAKGETGASGKDGRGVSQIVEQYYLSTSNTAQTGGSWASAQPAWSSGKYIWTRSEVTWSNGTTTYSTPVLAQGINKANETASTAKSTADSAKSAADAASNTLSTLNTQEGIFNKLTNNGALKGIYMSGGTLLINADYIKTGHISADTISGGTLLIKDSSGNVTAELSNGTDTGLMAYDPYYKKLRPLKWEAFRPIVVYSAVDQHTFKSSFDNQKYTVLTSAMTNGHTWTTKSEVRTSGSDVSEKAIKVIFGSNHMARITLLGSLDIKVYANVSPPNDEHKTHYTNADGEVNLGISFTDDSYDYPFLEFDVATPVGPNMAYGDSGALYQDRIAPNGSIGTSIIAPMHNETELTVRLKYKYSTHMHADGDVSYSLATGGYKVKLEKIVIEPI